MSAKGQFHEDYGRQREARGSSDRGFGIVFFVVFLVIALLPLRHGNPVRMWALGLSGLFLGVALVRPILLAPLNRAWMRFAVLLAKVTNPIVTGLLFFLAFTPFGWVARVLGKDSMKLRKEPGAESYWVKRDPPGPSADSMVNQF